MEICSTCSLMLSFLRKQGISAEMTDFIMKSFILKRELSTKDLPHYLHCLIGCE